MPIMPIIPWSYSFINDYSNCPHKAMRKYVTRDIAKPKDYDPVKAKPMHDGVAAHKQIENYMRGEGLIKPEWAKFVDPIRDMGAEPEKEYGITLERLPCGFWDEECYGRAKVDAAIIRPPVAFIFDWKTGKVREDKRELSIQAVLLCASHPELTTVYGAYVWLAENRVGDQHDVSNVDRCWNGTKAFIEQVQADTQWQKKPNPLCAYCPVKDCEFNKAS